MGFASTGAPGSPSAQLLSLLAVRVSGVGPLPGAGLSIPDSLRSIHLNSEKDAARVGQRMSTDRGVNIRVLVPLTCNENCKGLFTNWASMGQKIQPLHPTQTVTLSHWPAHLSGLGGVCRPRGSQGEGIRSYTGPSPTLRNPVILPE